MAAAAHGNVQIFNMLTDLTGNLDSNCSIVVWIMPYKAWVLKYDS